MSSRTRLHVLALASAVAPLGACSPTIQQPHLLHPGPAQYQRNVATQFDPYPQVDMGPKIVGGRPPDYQIPVPEVERARQFSDSQRAAIAPGPVLVPSQPVFGPTLPAYPSYPPGATYPAAPVTTTPAPPPASTVPPVQYRY